MEEVINALSVTWFVVAVMMLIESENNDKGKKSASELGHSRRWRA